MSSVNTTFGTQSPPLEATLGGEQPMGVSSIRGDKPMGVPDREQRKDYFKEEWENARAANAAEAKETNTQKRERIKQE